MDGVRAQLEPGMCYGLYGDFSKQVNLLLGQLKKFDNAYVN